jgi:hypothetical protein
MYRYLLYPFIINYIHIYLLSPFLIYIGYNSLVLKTNEDLTVHYKVLVFLGTFTSIYHMKLLWDRSIWIIGLLFLLLAIIEYATIFGLSYYNYSSLLNKVNKKSNFSL